MGLLDGLQRKVGAVSGPVRDFDPGLFDDPLAMRVDWTPMARGGANMRTHQGGLVGGQLYQFSPTLIARIFPMIFVVGGLVCGALILRSGAEALTEQLHNPGWLAMLPIPPVFVGVGLFMARSMMRSAHFDRQAGWYWRGGGRPRASDPTGGERCRLSEIHALQLVPESVRSNEGGHYTSWELNLVLEDGSRRNVVDHAGYDSLAREAAELAEFLDVPLWNKNDAYRVEARG